MNRRGFFGMLAGAVGAVLTIGSAPKRQSPIHLKTPVGMSKWRVVDSKWSVVLDVTTHTLTPNQLRSMRGLEPYRG